VSGRRGENASPIDAVNVDKEKIMFARLVMLVMAIAVGSSVLSACNTVQGAGRDVERAGQKVQEEAIEHKRY
jgi:predicted small secreted protein